MTAEPMAHADLPVIHRPERTPQALRQALAQVAPHRLPEMLDDQTRAMAEALEADSLGPLHMFLLSWAAVIEIERFPETARRFHFAEQVATASDDPQERRRGLDTSAQILRAAYTALGA